MFLCRMHEEACLLKGETVLRELVSVKDFCVDCQFVILDSMLMMVDYCVSMVNFKLLLYFFYNLQ